MNQTAGVAPASTIGRYAELIARHAVMWRLLSPGDGPEDLGSEPPLMAEAGAAHSRCRVLVVDDDATIRQTLAALLEDDGYVVDQAANGLEALACLERQVPRIVLLDMRMPLMDGWAVAEEIHKRELTTSIVAMTATLDARTWAEEIGASSYIGKPFAPEEMLGLVDRLCRG